MDSRPSTIGEQIAAAVPFATHLGLQYTRLEPNTATVVLPQRPETLNHVGTQHAGALFTAGESASGAVVVGALAAHLSELRPLVADATITYRAAARGPVTATAALERPADDLLAEIRQQGSSRFNVAVELSDESGQGVASMVVTWHISRVPA